MKKRLFTLALMLILAVNMCASAFAAQPDVADPKASYYISGTMGYISGLGGGDLRISFATTGTRIMTAIGVTTIKLYRASDDMRVKTFSHVYYSNMLGSDTGYYGSYVSYEGVSGESYYAEITYYAGDTNGSDSKTYTTETVTV